jgi:thymidylate synthase (FAD)
MTDLYDSLAQFKDNEYTKVLDKGFLGIVDVMPRLVPVGRTGDCAIAQAARVSYGSGTKKVNEDEGLIRHMLRHNHTSAFEMCELKFHLKIPLFSFAQMVRHRTANVNQESARYSIMKEEFYIPQDEQVRLQSSTNKQGGDEIAKESDANDFIFNLEDICKSAYENYLDAIEQGIAREQARMLLPVNLYTQVYWKCDLHNIMNFMRLRLDSHAQYEIRVYAQAIYKFVQLLFPIACKAFEDYKLNSIVLTALDLEAIKTGIFPSQNKREIAEWEVKKALIGLS